jgi:hypothetical protein
VFGRQPGRTGEKTAEAVGIALEHLLDRHFEVSETKSWNWFIYPKQISLKNDRVQNDEVTNLIAC